MNPTPEFLQYGALGLLAILIIVGGYVAVEAVRKRNGVKPAPTQKVVCPMEGKPPVCLWTPDDVVHLRDQMAKWEKHYLRVVAIEEWVRTQGKAMHDLTRDMAREATQYLNAAATVKESNRRNLAAIAASLKAIREKVEQRA